MYTHTHKHTHTYMYIYIYIERERERVLRVFYVQNKLIFYSQFAKTYRKNKTTSSNMNFLQNVVSFPSF